MPPHLLASGLAALILLGCGRTAPGPGQEYLLGERLEAGDGGAECLENAECADDSICIDGACMFFGECNLAQHCGLGQSCEEHVCVGEILNSTREPPICEINADCEEGYHCVDERCRLGVQCRAHAHCAAGKACVRTQCVAAF